MNVLKANFFIQLSLIGIKIFFVHLLLFREPSWQGVLFDIFFIYFLFSLFELFFQRKKTLFYLFTNIFLSICFFVLLLYNEYFGGILTYKDFFHAHQVPTILESIIQLIKPAHLAFFLDLFIIFFFLLFKKRNHPYMKISKKKIIILLTVTTAFILFIETKNNVETIVNETALAKKMGIFRYEFHVINGDNKNEVVKEDQYFLNKLQQLKGTDRNSDQKKFFGLEKDKHLIVIQLEAVQTFPIHFTINNQEITPTLNRLVNESIFFPNVFQQVGKGNTSDAEFIFNTSLYPSNNIATTEQYGDRSIPSLAKLLDKKGYRTVTFHTNDVQFWNREEFYEAIGFHEVYDQSFFGTDDVISYGASDEILYEKAVNKLIELDRNGNKFFAHLISLSSHHPFKIPEDKQRLQLPTEYKDSVIGDYLQAIAYADFALGKFLAKLKKEKMDEKSLIVVYGDHFGLDIKTTKDRRLMKNLLGREYDDQLDKYNVPFIIHSSSFHQPMTSTIVGGQVDMLPTIANLMGIELTQFVYFGQDLLNSEDNLIGNRFYLPTGTFMKNDLFFIPGEGFFDGKAYSMKTREAIEEFHLHFKSYEEILELLELSDQYLNSLPKRNENIATE